MKLALLISALLLFSCQGKSYEVTANSNTNSKPHTYMYDLHSEDWFGEIKVFHDINGCEYLIFKGSQAGGITQRKGSCPEFE